jgi:ribosomal protein L40E
LDPIFATVSLLERATYKTVCGASDTLNPALMKNCRVCGAVLLRRYK